MPKHIRFIQLVLTNFTSHRSLKLNYGNINKLSGPNGAGKTSIGAAPSWILFGNDLQGKTFNPSPTNYEFDRVSASLLIDIDGKQVKFERGIEGGDIVYLVNDVPTKAREYNTAVASLFDKEEFLSLYNPQFFFTQHWTKQREQIMKHTTAPAKSEVLKDLPEVQSSKLSELTKKHNLDDLQKIHGGTGGQKSKLEKQYIAAQSRTKTLQEQLERLGDESIDPKTIHAQIAAMEAEIKEIEKVVHSAGETNRKIAALDGQIKSLLEQRNAKKTQFPALQNEPVDDICRTCRQPLKGESIKAAEEEKQKRIERFKAEYDAIVTKRIELETESNQFEYIDVSEQMTKIHELERQLEPLREKIRNHAERERLQTEVEKAKTAETDTLTALKESIFILDAIKSYRSKEAELQADKVQSLFTNLSIRLFKYVKSTGEYEPDFSVQMDGKDYSILSTGEKIAAGLELAQVLFKQSELIVPCFVDGIGEYTGKITAYDQLITARAVPDQELKIETEDAA